MSHDELLARHRAVLPSWLALYYDEPIELVEGQGRHVDRRRGQPLPRLLRRDPDDDDGLRRARGDRRHPRAGGADDPHLHPLPHPPAGGAGRDDRRPVRHPRPPGVLHHVGDRGERGRPAGGVLVPPVEPDRGRAQQLPRSLVRHDRHHREPGLVAVVADPVPGQLHAVRLPLPEPVPPPGRRRLHRGLHRGPARRDRDPDRGRHRRPDRRARPGRRRLRHPPRRLLRPGREGVSGARHALHRRRGADRLGPDRRPLLGPSGPRHHPRPDDLRQGGRQRADHRRRGRPGRGHELGVGQLHLHLRRQPPVLRRGPGQPPLPARPRPPGQHQGPGGRADGRPGPAGRAPPRHRRDPGEGPDDRPRVRRRRRPDPRPPGRLGRARGLQGPRPAGRQGRPPRQLPAHRPTTVTDRRGSRRGRGDPHRRPWTPSWASNAWCRCSRTPGPGPAAASPAACAPRRGPWPGPGTPLRRCSGWTRRPGRWTPPLGHR